VRKHTKKRRLDNTIWHYTVGWKLASILNTRTIFRTIVGIVPPEKPVTWFSRNRIWEPTASKMSGNDLPKEFRMQANHAAYGRLFRIGIQERHAPYEIQDLRRIAHTNRHTVEDLIRSGIRMGANPEDWRFAPKNISSKIWIAIEVWDGKGRWLPFDGEMPKSDLIGTRDLIAQ